MDNTSIKNNIREARKSRKITQEEMAFKLGISANAYRDFEKGGTAIFNGNIFKIAEILNVSIEELLLGFLPMQVESNLLEESRKEYSGKVASLEQRIVSLETLVATLRATIEDKNEIIATKKEIIKMQKKRLGEDE